MSADLVPISPTDLPALPFRVNASAALAHAETIADVRPLHDRAAALHRLLRDCRDGHELFAYRNDVAELKLRAERKLGVLLRNTAARGRYSHDASTGQMRGATRTLPEGITSSQSHRWQKIADVPESIFDEWIKQARAAGEDLSQMALFRYVQAKENDLPLNVDGPDDEDDEKDAEDVQDGRPIRLLVTPAQRRAFSQYCRSLKAAWNLTDQTALVLEALRLADEAEVRS